MLISLLPTGMAMRWRFHDSFIFEVGKGRLEWINNGCQLALTATKRLDMCLYVRVRKKLGCRVSRGSYVAVRGSEILI